MEGLQAADALGSARVFEYGDGVVLSPYTLRLVGIAGDLQSHYGDLFGKRVVQIGAGYGGLCKVLHDLYQMDGYAIVDLPEHLALAQKYLESLDIRNVEYIPVDELKGFSGRREWDLVLSDRFFSEFDSPYQDLMLSELFSRARSGYVLGHVFPKHFGVSALDVEAIEKKTEENCSFR